MARMSGKHVVVTGASSGIGRAIARAFGAEGATVWLGARREAELQAAAREVDAAGGTGRAVRLDVTDERSVAEFAAQVEACDVLVNNAGVGGSGLTADLDVARWRRAIDTNLTGPFLVTKAFIPKLRARDGRRSILNVVSVAGKSAWAGGGAYCASKFGLRGWSEALALEMAEEGIRVTAVLPGYVDTALVKGAAETAKMIDPDELARQIVALHHMPESMFVDELVIWPWRMYTD